MFYTDAMEILLFASVVFTWLPSIGSISSLTHSFSNANLFTGQLYAKDNAACLFQAYFTQFGETAMFFNVVCVQVFAFFCIFNANNKYNLHELAQFDPW